ncbi:MAG TPA: hypothetical protein VG826_34975 [Pirellulales bacterium]|nr:hypothetical protein [Pirellulales bacterium]
MLLVTGWLTWIVDAVLLLVAVIVYGVLFFLIGVWGSRGIDLVIRGPRPPEPRT